MAAMLAPAGCSLGGDDEPKPVSGAPKAIAATVDGLRTAIAEKNYETVCDDLFTAAARKRSGGDDCPAQLRSASEDVTRPVIEISGIQVKGDRATVTVMTRAENQARVSDALLLRRVGSRWRIEALSG